MPRARSQAVASSAVKRCATRHSTVEFISASSHVIKEHATPVAYLRRLSASVARRLKTCSAVRRASLARSPADVLSTARTTSVTRFATRASVCPARKIHLVRSTAPVAMPLSRVYWEERERTASSLCPSATLYAKGSCPVVDTSVSNSVTMAHACDVKSWSTRAASATRARSNTPATK